MILSGTPRAQQTHRARMAKGVGSLPALRDDAGRSEASARNAVEDRAVFERTMRCLDAQEHLPMRAWRTRLLQVSKHGFARFAQ